MKRKGREPKRRKKDNKTKNDKAVIVIRRLSWEQANSVVPIKMVHARLPHNSCRGKIEQQSKPKHWEIVFTVCFRNNQNWNTREIVFAVCFWNNQTKSLKLGAVLTGLKLWTNQNKQWWCELARPSRFTFSALLFMIFTEILSTCFHTKIILMNHNVRVSKKSELFFYSQNCANLNYFFQNSWIHYPISKQSSAL